MSSDQEVVTNGEKELVEEVGYWIDFIRLLSKAPGVDQRQVLKGLIVI
jgi:hypothetical protein